MKLMLSFTNYESSDIGVLVEFDSVISIHRTQNGKSLRVQPAKSTAAHIYPLDKIADIRLAVLEGK